MPSEIEFVLYKSGPDSFDLHDLRGEMRADLLIDRETRLDPCGPTLEASASGANFLRRHASTTGPYRAAIGLVAEEFGGGAHPTWNGSVPPVRHSRGRLRRSRAGE